MSDDTTQWIEFEERGLSTSGKTTKWFVRMKDCGPHLGEINWYAPWRCYSFFPYQATVFEGTCLNLIGKFCDDQTVFHNRKMKPVPPKHGGRPMTLKECAEAEEKS